MIDALLFLGSVNTTETAPPSEYDEAYLAELKRRAAILQVVFGVDFVDEVSAVRR